VIGVTLRSNQERREPQITPITQIESSYHAVTWATDELLAFGQPAANAAGR
jgi:hypothetical protein